MQFVFVSRVAEIRNHSNLVLNRHFLLSPLKNSWAAKTMIDFWWIESTYLKKKICSYKFLQTNNVGYTDRYADATHARTACYILKSLALLCRDKRKNHDRKFNESCISLQRDIFSFKKCLGTFNFWKLQYMFPYRQHVVLLSKKIKDNLIPYDIWPL